MDQNVGLLTQPVAEREVPSIRPLSGAGLMLDAITQLIRDVHGHLKTILPEDIFAGYTSKESELAFDTRLQALNQYLPYIHWKSEPSNPNCLAVFIVGKKKARFSQDDFAKKMLTHWLVPDKVLHILAHRQLDFFFERQSQAHYYFLEYYIELETKQDREYSLQNMPRMLHELRKGLLSSKDAFNTLNTKGINAEEKDVLIVNHIRSMLQRRPQEYDKEFINEVQQFLFQSPAEFKQVREVSHLSRVVSAHYFFRKNLLRLLNQNNKKRHVALKMLRTKLHYAFGEKKVLSFVIGVNELNPGRELLDDQHLIAAVNNVIADANLVKGSFLSFQYSYGPIKTLYFEIVRPDNMPFSLSEVQEFQARLPNEIKMHIEHLVPITFMRRNEEEVYRNLLTLREQIKYLRDIPQAMISFEEQTTKDLYFTVVLVRLLKEPDEKSVEELFKEANPGCRFIPDRRECVGYLRKKYPKEANVFRVQLPKADFLRKDRSVDVYKARQYISLLLTNALGKIRDYNGGLIIKQDERLQAFLHSLPQEDSFLLENFFYSLTPIAMQGVLKTEFVQEFYKLFKKVLTQDRSGSDTFTQGFVQLKGCACAMYRSDETSLKDTVAEAFASFDESGGEWAASSLNIHGTFCFGYILLSSDREKQDRFLEALRTASDSWMKKIYNRQHLRINLACKTPTLDPRITRSDNSATIVKLLYEGLTRMGKDKKPMPAIAERIEVSDDGKRYTFYLRESCWSDGSAITAHDFEYSWKKVLETSKNAHYHYTFKVIKNARAIFDKKMDVDTAGIHAINPKTLVVDLEYPVPYFLEFTSHWTYLLINSKVDRSYPGWAYHDGATYVCNGPFKLKEWKQNREIVVEKNPDYWDAASVSLEQITVSMEDNPFTELRMFENGEIDMTGIGTSSLPVNRLKLNRKTGELQTLPAAGVYSLWVNTDRFPYNNKNFRKALSLAIDRKEMQKHLSDDESVTNTVLPHSLSQFTYNKERERDIREATRCFQMALDELEIRKNDLPILHIGYSTKRRKTVCELVEQNWTEIFGIAVRIEEYDWGTLYNNAINGKHHIAGIAWYSWFWDPNYILSSFSHDRKERTPTLWKNREYIKVIEESHRCLDNAKRTQLLKKAEEMLIEESPVIPLHQCSTAVLKKPYVHGVHTSELLETDFKWAYIKRNDEEK